MRTLKQKVDLEPRGVAGGGGKKRGPLDRTCVKNITLRQKVGLEASKTRTLRQKVRQKHVPLSKKSVPLGTPEQLPSLQGHPPWGSKKTRVLSFQTNFLVNLATCWIGPPSGEG